MSQNVSYCGVALAMDGVLGPVPRNRRFVFYSTTFSLHVQGRGSHRFANRKHVKQCLAVNKAIRGDIGKAAPRIHHEFTIHISRNLNTDFSP
jgi:hypothetical protein